MKKKWIIIAVVVAVVVIVVIWWRMRGGSDEKKEDAAQTPEDYKAKLQVEQEIERQYQAIKSYNDDYYKKMAGDLEAAMKGVGTRENTVMDVFDKIKSNADCKALIEAFGTRRYKKGGDKKDLFYWIEEDLTPKERDKINSNLRNKKIEYSFFEC